jgi:hypothetical protein
MVPQVSIKSDTYTEKSQLAKHDIRLTLVLCAELVNLCARLTGKIDPAAGLCWPMLEMTLWPKTRMSCNKLARLGSRGSPNECRHSPT